MSPFLTQWKCPWDAGFPGAPLDDVEFEQRMFTAFRMVLVAMPEEDFARFMEERPTIVCPHGINRWSTNIGGPSYLVPSTCRSR